MHIGGALVEQTYIVVFFHAPQNILSFFFYFLFFSFSSFFALSPKSLIKRIEVPSPSG